MYKDGGIDVFTIGLGEHFNANELMALSTSSDHFINGCNFTLELASTAALIGDKICQLEEKSTFPSAT